MDINKFIENKSYFNISQVEVACDIPSGVLRGVVAGTRKLPDKYVDSLDKFIVGLLGDVSEVVRTDVPLKEKKVAAKVENKKSEEGIPEGYEKMRAGHWRHIMAGVYTDGRRNIKPLKIGDEMYVPKE